MTRSSEIRVISQPGYGGYGGYGHRWFFNIFKESQKRFVTGSIEWLGYTGVFHLGYSMIFTFKKKCTFDASEILQSYPVQPIHLWTAKQVAWPVQAQMSFDRFSLLIEANAGDNIECRWLVVLRFLAYLHRFTSYYVYIYVCVYMLWRTVAMSPTLAFPRVNRSTTRYVHPFGSPGWLSVLGSHPSRAFSDRNCFWWSSHPSCSRKKKKNPEPSQQLATCHCPHQVRETCVYIYICIILIYNVNMNVYTYTYGSFSRNLMFLGFLLPRWFSQSSFKMADIPMKLLFAHEIWPSLVLWAAERGW